MDAYRAESALVMAILRESSDFMEKVSVDEAYLEVTPRFGHLEPDEALRAALPLARGIKERIASERRLTASIGLAANKFLSKLGSDFQKPDGLTLIPEEGKAAFLAPLPLGRIPGVGPVTERALAAHGFKTISDLQQATVPALTPAAGSFAARLRQLAFGEDDRPLDLSDERKSISSETTFLEDTDHRPTLRDALKELCADVAETLAKNGLGAQTVQVKVRYSDFTTLTRQLRVEDAVLTQAEIYRLACHLLARDKLVHRPLRLLGVGVSHLVPPARQLRLAI
jgi:DNA polymerase-4